MELFREQDLDWLKSKGDEALDWESIFKGLGGKIAEAGDGLVISLFTKQLNKWVSPKLSDEIKQELHDVFDRVMEKDYENALVELADVGEIFINSDKVSDKVRPWLLAFIEIYKGIIVQLV